MVHALQEYFGTMERLVLVLEVVVGVVRERKKKMTMKSCRRTMCGDDRYVVGDWWKGKRIPVASRGLL